LFFIGRRRHIAPRGEAPPLGLLGFIPQTIIGCGGDEQQFFLRDAVLTPLLDSLSNALQHDYRDHEARGPRATAARYSHRARSDEERRTGGLLRFLAAMIELADDHFAGWLWRGFHQLYTMRAASGRVLDTRAVLHDQPG
jgi:hypothetical protein